MVEKTKILKKKRKKWFPIIAPKEFSNIEIGESLAENPSELIGKQLTLSLMALTNDIKRQYINVTFLVKEIKENKAFSEVIGYSLSIAHLKRLTKRAKTKIEDSYILKTKDGITVRIKPVILTKNKAHHAILTELSKKAKEAFTAIIENTTFDELVQQLVTYNLQKNIKSSLKKVYPISTFDIKIFKKILN